ncbi:MAG: hypothetical protein WD971_00300 [Pirellulales bacterium]
MATDGKTAATAQEFQSFCLFAEQRLRDDQAGESLDDLYVEWRSSNPSPEELETNVLAVRAALRDMDAGETGRTIEEFAAEFQRRNGI